LGQHSQRRNVVDGQNTPAITKELLFSLINALLPEQPGHFVRPGARDGEVWFNPQPDPPGSLRQDPWRSVSASRTIISVAALATSGGANQEDGLPRSRAMLKAFVDDFCGTGPRVLLPAPWPRFDLKPNALDIVIAAAQFHSAANALKDQPLGKDLADGAERLLQAAVQKLAR